MARPVICGRPEALPARRAWAVSPRAADCKSLGGVLRGCLRLFASHLILRTDQALTPRLLQPQFNQKVCDGQRRHPNPGTCGRVDTRKELPENRSRASLHPRVCSSPHKGARRQLSARLPPAASTACRTFCKACRPALPDYCHRQVSSLHPMPSGRDIDGFPAARRNHLRKPVRHARKKCVWIDMLFGHHGTEGFGDAV